MNTFDPIAEQPEGPFSICETCHGRIDPADPSLVYAVELVSTGSMGDPHGVAEGLGAWFHERCYPATSRRYRRKPKPNIG